MRRLLVAIAVVFAFGLACTGGSETPEENEDPVVVPVDPGDDDDDDEDDEDWCCEFKDDDGTTQYALVDGPGQCNTEYGDRDGRYVSGNQCIPCCCQSLKNPDEPKKGKAHELTTPKSCVNAEGECIKDMDKCGDGGGDDGADRDKKKPPPKRPAPRPGSGRDRKVIKQPR